jgi:hypothetical protein
LSRRQCRATFERRFNVTRMATEYVWLYQKLAGRPLDAAFRMGAA